MIKIISCFLASLLTCAAVRAEDPATFINSTFSAVRSAKSLMPFIERVDWKEAYRRFIESGETLPGVNSAESLRADYEESNTPGHLSRKLREAVDKIPEEQRKPRQHELDETIAKIDKFDHDFPAMLAGLDCTAAESKLYGTNSATAKVTCSDPHRTSDVELIADGQSWRFVEPDFSYVISIGRRGKWQCGQCVNSKPPECVFVPDKPRLPDAVVNDTGK